MDQAKWWNAVENPLAVTNIYSEPPELAEVRIMHVEVDEQGPTALVKLELPAFPDKPPLRWHQHENNAAILELRLFGISKLHLEGWTTNNTATVTLLRGGGLVNLEIIGHDMHLSASGIAADIHRIEGYRRAQRSD